MKTMNKRYTIRMTIVFFMFLIAYGLIAFTLYRIQYEQHDFYKNLGTNQYNVTVTCYPPRGVIIDRTGKQFLAMNTQSVCAICLPRQIKNKQAVIAFLKQHFPHRVQAFMNNQDKSFMYIERRLNDEKIAHIKQSGIEDIYLINEPSRFYPVPSAAQIVGLTNVDNEGVAGIELLFNKHLMGTPSTVFLQKDARSGYHHFKKQVNKEGTDGKPLQLTIDADLQFLVQEQVQETVNHFQAKEGAAIVMNPANGEILAMVSVPTFDPNNTQDLDIELTKNKVITENYELGSVIKVLGAIAALEEKVVSFDEIINCDNIATTYIDKRKVNTVKSSIAGEIPFCQVIEKSNNIGIAKVATRLGPRLYDHYMRMGFGKKTGIEFLGERTGFVNPPERWSKQSIFSLSYGYEVTATLLQLANVFAMIARDGYPIQPTLILGKNDNLPSKASQKPLYSEQTMREIKEILENTVVRGTAKKAQVKGYRIMSKTGTANVLENGVYNDKKHRYTCAGIVERGDYQRVIVTFIKESPLPRLYASSVAAPLFEQIAEKVLIHDKVV